MSVHVEGMEIGVGPSGRWWGTWEELILGGAVLRHGTQDWDVVAAELRCRTLYPHCFTPEVCKARYEDLLKLYSGRKACFEELRKRRMEELKRELERSEESIGSLETMLESLKAEKGHYNAINYDFSQTESHIPMEKPEGIESYGKDSSKDEPSAGSFTQDDWTTTGTLDSGEPGMVLIPEKPTKSTFHKRRGKKRKGWDSDPKEGSIGESENLGSNDVVTTTTSQCKDDSSGDYGLTTVGSSGIDSHDDLVRIFNCLAENEYALVFQNKLDSQKRARYRKLIRCHMDLDTIRSKIATRAIESAKQVFRDLLLVANNALAFYSKRTCEYKSALSLRDLVLKKYRQLYGGSGDKPLSCRPNILGLSNPPVKPRSALPNRCKRQFPVNFSSGFGWLPVKSSPVKMKKSTRRLGKSGCGGQVKTPAKERKRGRQKVM